MMPGETHSNTAGLATEGPGIGCQNCSVLQQNLNENVGAFVALKQKIIETDHLLTKYQQKCDELQVTERENSTLRHQLEQMLQKIATHDHCLGELESLQSELEEKKSSLKIYQDIQEEYIRVKEEVEQSDFGKKKLEARVKKLEDAAAKHSSDMKQLKVEKKTIEKELKKTQAKLEEFHQERRKKRMKHAVTQFTSEEPAAMVDKKKIKHLLEELWVCLDFAAQEQKNIDAQSMLEQAPKKRRRSRKSSDYILPPSHSSLLETSEMHSSERLTGRDNEYEETSHNEKNKSFEDHAQDGDSAFYEDKATDTSLQKDFACSSLHCSDEDDDDELGEKLRFVLNWARPLPPLLSPVQLSPSRTQDELFGALTDSSDDEIVCSTSKAEPSSDDGALECQINCTFVSGQKKLNKDTATKEGPPHVLKRNSSNERDTALQVTESLSPHLDNMETVSSKRKKSVKIEDQAFNHKPSSGLNSELMQIKRTQNIVLTSNHHQSKTSELAPSQEEAGPITNTPAHHENGDEESNKAMQSEGDTWKNDDRSANLQHSSELFNAPMESHEITCKTVHSLVFECSSDILANQAVAIKDKFSVFENLSENSNNVFCANRDRLPTPDVSEDTVQNCVSLDSIKLITVKGNTSLAAKDMFYPENSCKSKVGKDTKKKLDTDVSLVDPHQCEMTSSIVVQDKTSVVGTKISSRCLFEHSYAYLAQNITNTCHRDCLEGKIADKEISREPNNSKNDEMEMNTVSVEVIASNVQKLETMSSAPVIFNEQGPSDTENIVTSFSSVTQTTRVFSEENAENYQSNKPSTKHSVHAIENHSVESTGINSNSAFKINCIEPQTAEVASVTHAVRRIHSENVSGPKSLSNPVEISKSLESEQKCIDKIAVNTKDNLDMCKLVESANIGLSVQLMKLQTTSSVTSEQDCKNLEIELRPESKSEFPPQKIILKNAFEPLASDKRTVVTKTVMVEPEDPCLEAGTSLHPKNVCVSSEIKAQNQSAVSSLRVCCTGKLASSLSKSNTGRECETFEKKAEVDNCVSLTNIRDNVFPLGQTEPNHTGIQISHSDEASKMNVARRDSKLNQSLSTDRSIAPATVPPNGEQNALNTKMVAMQVANLDKGGVPCIDHDAIAIQFAMEAGQYGNSIQSKNIVINTVNQTSAKSSSQQCICIVNSEKHLRDKHESCCQEGRDCEKADTFTHILPILNKQGLVDAQVNISTGSEQPSCSSTNVIPGKDEEFSSCEQSGIEHGGNPSNLLPENIKHFKSEQNHLSFSVLCRQGAGALQNLFNATSLPRDDSNGLVSVNIAVKHSEETDNTMKGRHTGCPEENVIYQHVPSFRSARDPTDRNIHDSTPGPSTIKLEEEDSDLEDDFPVRKVSNTNRHIYRKPNRKKYMDDMLKLTKMLQRITTFNDQEDSKMTPSLNADKRFKAQHLTVSLANAAISEIKQTNHLSGIMYTKVKCDQQAACSFDATSLASNSLSECNPEADQEEAFSAKIVDEKNASLMLSVKPDLPPSGKLVQCLTEDSTLESGSVQVQMLADHVPVTGDFDVKNTVLTMDRTVGDIGINVKSGTGELETEPQREHHQTDSHPPGTAPFCQGTDEQGLDLSVRKLEQRFLLSSGGESNRVSSHAVQPNGKAGSSGKHCIWNIPTIDSDLGVTKYKNNYDLRSSHRTLLPEFFSVCKGNENNTLSKNIKKASNVLLNDSGMAASKAHTRTARFRIAQGRGKVKGPLTTENQPIVANADTSTKTKHSPDTISKVRSEMGPPLPPLLQPLIVTPPRTLRPVSPIMSTSSRSSLPSPLDDLISPLRETPVAPLVSPLSDDQRYKSLFTTPSPSERATKRIVSSPLQFCAATPKHALPVPGRLPPSASGKAPPSVPQENSVKILDSMYPELSAQARTLNILKGNIQLNRCSPADCKHLPGPVNKITGFKAITSTSTAFVKTGKNSQFDGTSVVQQDVQLHQLTATSLSANGKRATMTGAMPRSAKRLCLGIESPNLDAKESGSKCSNKEVNACDNQADQVENPCPELSSSVLKISEANDEAVNNALKKIGDSCFDLLPVIRSHVHVGNISVAPVMRDEEKEVVHECTVTKKDLAEPVLHAIVKKLKGEMMSLENNHLQALCRVYVGICRQLGDLERARLFCYNILKEDFPESAKLTLFIISVWQDIFLLPGVVNKAMQSLMKHRAKGDVLACLTAYLKWEKGSPLNVGIVLSSVLLAIQLCPNMKFQLNEEYGEDLSDGIWQYVYAIDLLCCHRKWVWTHDNVISKELWPIMDKWVKYKKGCLNVTFTSDISVAAVLRLIGRLSQIGLKEGFVSAVKNISSVISTFIQHAKEEDMPWEVQLASVYALCDMASGDPAGVLVTLQTWRRITTNDIPPAVLNYISEISALCRLQN
ncbi:little elongation complex subunit 1 isoform X2 [Lissotriton helveticus]